MSAERKDPSGSSATKWWQWVLMYPTLVITLIGAVPQYSSWLRAFILDVPASELEEEQKREEAYFRNDACYRTAPPTVVQAQAIEVEVIPCPSGDIHVKAVWPDEQHPNQKRGLTKWLLWEDLRKN